MLSSVSFRKELLLLLGNVLDHFDTYLYVFLAPHLAPLFFPNDDYVVSLLLSYSVLISSIFSRIIGSYLFSNLALKCGPLNSLSYSLLGIGLASALIGLLPTYETLGPLAAILLVLLRIIIGLCASGESAISAIYLLEGKEGRCAIRSSYRYQTSTMVGIILASIASTIIYYCEVQHLWRLFFILGGVTALIGYAVRKTMISAVSLENESKYLGHYANLRYLWSNVALIIKIAIVTGVSQLTYVIPFVVMNHLVPLVSHVTIVDMMTINSFMLFFDLFAIPVIGEIIATKPPAIIMRKVSFILAALILPIWLCLPHVGLPAITILRLLIVILGIIFLCPLNIWCKQQESSSRKYLLISCGRTLSSIFIGKITPLVCLAIYHFTGDFILIGCYFSMLFFGAWCVLQI